MRLFIKGLCLVLLVLLFLSLKTSLVSATTYYVDATGGNNNNTGTSTDAPWQTIAKVNSTTFASGDYVYFKRGETWTSAQSTDRVIGSSGVTYGAYGSGNAPIIDGNHVSDGFIVQNTSNVTLENLEIRNGYDAGAQFINTTGSTVTNCEMSGAGNDNLIFITNNNNVTVSGGKYHDPVRRVPTTLVTNIELADGGSNFTINNVELYGAESAGITIHNHVGTQIPTNVTINNMYSHNNTTGNGLQILSQDNSNPVNINVTNSRFISNNTGIRVFISGSYYVSGNVLFDGIISGNNSAYGFYIEGDDVTIQRSVFYGNQAGRLNNAKRMKFYNNTSYMTPSTAIFMFQILGGARVDTVTTKNNIFYMTNTTGNFMGSAALSSTNWVVDYNEYYFSPYAGNARWMKNGTTYSFANWKATAGNDTHGLGATSNPLFVGAASQDFRLQSGSPSINAGVDVGLSYSGSAPDIGAYEYAPPTAPSSLAQSVSGNSLTFTFSMSSLNPTDTLTPNIEVQPWDTPFTNTANFSGSSVAYSGSAVTGTVSVPNFGSGKFHWQAMANNYAGNSSWTQYGSGSTGVDFDIGFSAPNFPVCTDTAPKSIPRLYLADSSDSSSILLSFVQADQPVTKYMIQYGTKSGKYNYAVDNINVDSKQYLIGYLSPSTKYYFQIAAANKCAATSWSDEFSASTTGGSEKIDRTIPQENQKPSATIEPSPSSDTDSSSSGAIVSSYIQRPNCFQKIRSFFYGVYSRIISFLSHSSGK